MPGSANLNIMLKLLEWAGRSLSKILGSRKLAGIA